MTPLSNFTSFTIASFTAAPSLDSASSNRTPFGLDLVCGHAATFLARVQSTRVVDDIKNIVNGMLVMIKQVHRTATQWQDSSWMQHVPTLYLAAALRRLCAFLMLSWRKSSIFTENDSKTLLLRKSNVSAVDFPETFVSASVPTNTTPMSDIPNLNSSSLPTTTLVVDDAAMMPIHLVLLHPVPTFAATRLEKTAETRSQNHTLLELSSVISNLFRWLKFSNSRSRSCMESNIVNSGR